LVIVTLIWWAREIRSEREIALSCDDTEI